MVGAQNSILTALFSTKQARNFALTPGSEFAWGGALIPENPPRIFSKRVSAQNSKLTALFNVKRAQNFELIPGPEFVFGGRGAGPKGSTPSPPFSRKGLEHKT